MSGVAFLCTSLELFLFFDLPRSNSAGENVVPCHPPKKILTLSESLFTPFSGSKRLPSLHLVNIQTNLKPHSPPKFSGSAAGNERSKFSIVNRSC